MKYCPSCATALDPDARFCPSCRTSVSVGAALASELRAGMQSGVRTILQSPSLEVPRSIRAVVIQFFWLLVDVALLLMSIAGFIAAGMNNALQQMISLGSSGTGWAMLLALLVVFIFLIQVSFDATLVFGFLTEKRWIYGLFFWSCLPRGLWMLLSLVGLLVVAGSSGSLPLVPLISYIALGGLFFLQIKLVSRSKAELAGEV